jgi:hypothetical protein
MTEELFGFHWDRPKAGDGFVVAEGPYRRFDRGAGDPANPSKLREVWEAGPYLRKVEVPEFAYQPMVDAPALFRDFADTEATPEGCLRFANRYGWLGIPCVYPNDHCIAEALIAWQVRILWLKYRVLLWDLALAGDQAGLSRYVRWGKGTLTFLDVPFEHTSFRAVLHHALLDPEQSFSLGSRHSHTLRAGPRVQPLDLIKPALFFCLSAVDELFDPHFEHPDELARVQPRLGWDSERGQPGLVMVPQSLWAAIVFQFALALDGNRRFQRCPVCSRWFALAPGVNRADRLTCSASCRVRLTRRRRDRAIELHQKGKGARQIAKEVGSKLENVQQWIQDHRDQKPKG